MTAKKEAIIKALRPYFQITELVCPDVYKKFNERAWQFLDTDALHVLLVLRESILCRPMYINNYGRGITQRGLRCNRCQLVKEKATVYLTQHGFGKAWDFTVEGMTAEQARQKIIAEQNKLPCPVRLERDKTWVHIDTLEQFGVTDKVYLFNG